MNQIKLSRTEKQFSRAASTYDREAQVHRNAANYLIDHARLPYSNSQILDIGCGTGILSEILIKQFHPFQIVNFDLSHNMLIQAKTKQIHSHFVLGDMEYPPFKNEFNIVVSNMSLQWLEDPKKIVRSIKTCLPLGGVFAVCIVMRGTFKLITEARQEVLKYDATAVELSSQAERLPIFEDLKQAFSEFGLELRRAEKHSFKQVYDSPEEPFSAIRNLGISGLSNRPLSPEEHQRLREIYSVKLKEQNLLPELDYVLGFFWGGSV